MKKHLSLLAGTIMVTFLLIWSPSIIVAGESVEEVIENIKVLIQQVESFDLAQGVEPR